MATVNLGAIKFNWKGAYNNSTQYQVDDVVSSGGSSYVCILASQGNAVSNGTYWSLMAQAGTNGTNGTDLSTTLTTQGDLVYRDGSGLQRLGAGTSGQFLKTQGTGANPVWGTVSSDCVKLASGTISSSSSVVIDGYYTSDYDYYQLHVMNIRNSNSNRGLYWRFRASATTLTAGNYRHTEKGSYNNNSNSRNQNQSGGWDDNNFSSYWDLSTGSDRGSNFIMDIFDPLSTGTNKFYMHRAIIDVQDATYVAISHAGGYYNGSTGAHSGIELFPQADNIASGKWKLYGFKN